MDLQTIEILLEKYFEGTTSIAEEKQLKAYFSSQDVAPHLEHYRNLFGYFKAEKEIEFDKKLPLQPSKQPTVKWIGIAASFVFLFGTAWFFLNGNSNDNKDLGTFENPEEAFQATQEALQLLSGEVNQGVEGIAVLKQYEQTKRTIFKKSNKK
jgi:hypothetical protein